MLQFSVNVDFKFFCEHRPAAIVVAHERSGTHFLMNALAACYGYVSTPWIDFDQDTLNINYFHPLRVRESLLTMGAGPLANVVKSHHPVDFFAGELERITERFVFFVVCRDPVAVMLSFWRFMHGWPWAIGPKCPDPLTFARSQPLGQMMRYQVRQYPSLLERWAAHVNGWLDAAAVLPRVVVVRYEDLDARYEETMQGLAPWLGREPMAVSRPAREFNVVPGGPNDPIGSGAPSDVAALRQLCVASVGHTMARLGYAARGRS